MAKIDKNASKSKEFNENSLNGAKAPASDSQATQETLPYLRIGTTFYKIVKYPIFFKGQQFFEDRMYEWKKEAITLDHGTWAARDIPKYDGFCNVPNHVDYKQAIGKFYNSYSKLPHSAEAGNCETSLAFVKHIFQEHYEFGLDYLTLLYLKPVETFLPILCLVSQEKNTGKSSFVMWLKKIFGSNMTINNNEDFDSQFNADWAEKLIIALDEALIEKQVIWERIKSLSTLPKYKIQGKFKNKMEIDFFGKFLLTSNFETTFLKIDHDEVRLWVRKIQTIPKDTLNTEILSDLEKEIPAFLAYLQARPLSTQKKTRMWFMPEQIWTPALQALKEASKPKIEKELKEMIIDTLLDFDLPEVRFTRKDLRDKLSDMGLRVGLDQINTILKQWGVEAIDHSAKYKSYFWGANDFPEYTTKQGRYLTFKKEQFVTDESKDNNFSNESVEKTESVETDESLPKVYPTEKESPF